jgi:DNA-binding IclR family transcriptional regulator
MLAHQDEARLRDLHDRLRKELRGAQAVPPLQDFNNQIAVDRKRGYVFHRSTVDPGLVSLAYPIRGHDSRVVAAVTVIVPEKLSDMIGGERALRPMVYETADAISRKIGYRG